MWNIFLSSYFYGFGFIKKTKQNNSNDNNINKEKKKKKRNGKKNESFTNIYINFFAYSMYIISFHIMHVVFDEINSKAQNFKCTLCEFFLPSLSRSLFIEIPSAAPIYTMGGCIHYGCFSLNIWKSIDRTAETNHRVHRRLQVRSLHNNLSFYHKY